MADLKGLKVAILVENGFEEVELTEPRKALDKAGAETSIVSPVEKKVRSWKLTDWGSYYPVDVQLDQAQPGDFDALLLPGGVVDVRVRAHVRTHAEVVGDALQVGADLGLQRERVRPLRVRRERERIEV